MNDGEDDDEGEEEGVAPVAPPKPKPKPTSSAKPKPVSRPPPLEPAGPHRQQPKPKPTPQAKQGAGGGQQKKAAVDRNALSACGDSGKASPSRPHDRELESSELGSLVGGIKSIAAEIVSNAPQHSRVRRRALMIDGHEACALQVIDGTRAAEYLDKDPEKFGAGVKRLFLAGPAGGEKLREILTPAAGLIQPDEDMDAETAPRRARGGLLGAGYAAIIGSNAG